MSNRCQSCEKMVALEFSDPEMDSDLEVAADEPAENANPEDKTHLTVTCTVRIVRACADCGDEMKAASLEMETDFDGPKGTGHEFAVDEDSIDQIEEGGGRYKKSYFGAEVAFTVKCECGCGFEHSDRMSDKVAASEMEEV